MPRSEVNTAEKRRRLMVWALKHGGQLVHPPTPLLSLARGAKVGDPAKNLLDYVQTTFGPEYVIGQHHRILCEKLEAVERGDIKRLMVFMPPRGGKSELISVRFPAWYMGRNPDKFVMATSYSSGHAEEFSGQVKEQFTHPMWPFKARLHRKIRAGGSTWRLESRYRGRYTSAGILGGITGKGAHLLLIDDPIKSRMEADSPKLRHRLWSWYINDARSRLQKPGGAIVLVQTRWHEDDLAGRMIEAWRTGGEEWDVLEIPAVAYMDTLKDPLLGLRKGEYEDPLGREPGEVMWPEMWPAEEVFALRDGGGDDQVSRRMWASLYQQRPALESGNLFLREWMNQRYGDKESILPLYGGLFVDSAFKKGVGTSFSVIAAWAATSTHYALMDVWRERVEFPELQAAISDMWAKWKDFFHFHKAPAAVYIEDKASGQSVIQTLRRLERIPLVPWSGPTKNEGADLATPYFESNRVLLPEHAPWLADWIDEHCAFPADRDDQVDTTSMALYTLTGKNKMPSKSSSSRTKTGSVRKEAW